MTDNPNKSPRRGFLRDSDGKIPRWKKILIAILILHIIFTVCDALGIIGIRGPGANAVLSLTGPGYLDIDDLQYRIEPKQNEIVMVWTESVRRSTLASGKKERVMHRIPLDPLPREFVRCFVEVTVDPDAPAVSSVHYSKMSEMPVFKWDNVIRTEPETLTAKQFHQLPPDMVFHMSVRPEDLRTLSGEFILEMKPVIERKDERVDETYSTHRIVFPYSNSQQDSRREMIVPAAATVEPYYKEVLSRRMAEHNQKSVSVAGVILRIVLMPFATIPDYFALIFYLRFISRWGAAFK